MHCSCQQRPERLLRCAEFCYLIESCYELADLLQQRPQGLSPGALGVVLVQSGAQWPSRLLLARVFHPLV